MLGDAHIAAVASMLANPARATILVALSDGRKLPAGELARRAGVSPSTVSAHLTKLQEWGLIGVEKNGQHRYFYLADPTIVHILEAIAMIAPTTAIHSLREAETSKAIRRARTCYNHLAGTLGVLLSETLVHKKMLIEGSDGYDVTKEGIVWFSNLGIDCRPPQKPGHLFAPHHVDWSERRHHLAGSLGAALAHRLFDLGWIQRMPSSRAILVTEIGKRAFSTTFEIDL